MLPCIDRSLPLDFYSVLSHIDILIQCVLQSLNLLPVHYTLMLYKLVISSWFWWEIYFFGNCSFIFIVRLYIYISQSSS